jgi:hypothetical protein
MAVEKAQAYYDTVTIATIKSFIKESMPGVFLILIT